MLGHSDWKSIGSYKAGGQAGAVSATVINYESDR